MGLGQKKFANEYMMGAKCDLFRKFLILGGKMCHNQFILACLNMVWVQFASVSENVNTHRAKPYDRADIQLVQYE